MKNLIYFAQEGWKSRIINKLKDWKKSFNNQMAASAIIESPAVMTAAGLKINKNGQVEYNHAQDKDVKQLRSNLQTIGEAAIAAPTLAGDVEATYQIVRHPVQTAKAVVKAGKEAVNAGKQLISKGKDVVLGFKTKRSQLIGYGDNPRFTTLGPDMNLYPDFKSMTREEKIRWLKTLQELALRVDLARNLDALHLTKTRLRNGGFERLKKSMIYDANNISNDVLSSSILNPPFTEDAENAIYDFIRNNEQKILKAKPTKGTAKEVQIKTKDTVTLHPEDAGTGVFDKYFAWFRNAPQRVAGLSKGNKGAAHEFTHYFYFPFRRPKGFDPRVGNLLEYLYYTSPSSQEIVARGTQLKNYFGLKEGEELTPEMWKYAQRHYISDVADNNMSTFFKAGNNKSPNHPFFLNWLNRNAPAIGTGITVGTTLNNYINNE